MLPWEGEAGKLCFREQNLNGNQPIISEFLMLGKTHSVGQDFRVWFINFSGAAAEKNAGISGLTHQSSFHLLTKSWLQ